MREISYQIAEKTPIGDLAGERFEIGVVLYTGTRPL